jgi:cell cycle related kinase
MKARSHLSLFSLQVHRAKSKTTGELVALKNMCYSEDNQRPIHVIREIEALEAMAGLPNIIQLLSLAEARYSISLVLEYCITDLGNVLRRSARTPLPMSVIIAIMRQLLQALNAVHAAGYAHRDVSPGNILIDPTGAVKLADFGQARRISSDLESGGENKGEALPAGGEVKNTSASSSSSPPSSSCLLTPIVGTRWYRSPELLFGAKHYTTSIDMWSVGCIFAELLTGHPFFPGNSDIDQICKIRDKLGSMSEEIWPGVKDLPDWGKLIFPPLEAKKFEEMVLPGTAPDAIEVLSSCLRYDPASRLTPAQALELPFFLKKDDYSSSEEVLKVIQELLAKPKAI